jgi:hypothetical protein
MRTSNFTKMGQAEYGRMHTKYLLTNLKVKGHFKHTDGNFVLKCILQDEMF